MLSIVVNYSIWNVRRFRFFSNFLVGNNWLISTRVGCCPKGTKIKQQNIQYKINFSTLNKAKSVNVLILVGRLYLGQNKHILLDCFVINMD